jgi:two-component system chemotaxis response regulator CheY
MSKTILVVDDSSTMRGATVRVLKDAGYSTLEAADGLLALQVCEREKNNIKLIICDVNMPNMDGLTFLAKLKETSYGRFMPVIMLTTESQKAKIEEGRSLGARAWIVKPFNEQQLLDGVKRLLM